MQPSIVILTYNSEDSLPLTLASVKGLSKDIHIVDSFSKDRTLEIARQHELQITQHVFTNYGAQRNWAIDNLSLRNDWQLHLDADERISPELAEEIAALDESVSQDGFYIPRNVVFMGREIRHGGMAPTWHMRLFRTGKGRCEKRLYDQHFHCSGPTKQLRGVMYDDIRLTLSEWTARHNRWADAEVNELQSGDIDGHIAGRFGGNPVERKRFLRLVYNQAPLFLRTLALFVYRYFCRFGFLDGKEGLIFFVLQTFWFRFLVDAKLYEYHRRQFSNAIPPDLQGERAKTASRSCMYVEGQRAGDLPATVHRVYMVGAFPPPVHGMAVVNEAVCKELEQIGTPVVGINIAAASLDRSIITRVARFPIALRGLLQFAIRAHRGETLYISVSGGLGQLYELLFLFLARLREMRIFLHHHSFAYLDQRKALTTLLVSVAGSGATHITLSDGMAVKLRCTYHKAKCVVAISNAVLLFEESGASAAPHRALTKIGYLGNISAEKGVFEFLDVAEKLEAIDQQIRVVLTGPFQDLKIERLVRERLTRLRSVDYAGPKFGSDKVAFFRDIDVLLFPTRLNEAEPLTIHEAMMHGVPVIAYGQGAIREIVFPHCGLVIDPAQDFIERAVAQLQAWRESPQALQEASKAARERFLEICGENKERWESVRAEICG